MHGCIQLFQLPWHPEDDGVVALALAPGCIRRVNEKRGHTFKPLYATQPISEFTGIEIEDLLVNNQEIGLDTFGCLYCAFSAGEGEDFTCQLELQRHVRQL